MAAYAGSGLNGLPNIYRTRQREVWKLDEPTDFGGGLYSRTYLEDQLRTQREEIRRKDDLIRELSSSAELGGCPLSRPLPCQSARGEMAALQMKLRERQLDLDAANEAIGRLRGENERLREENVRLLAQVDCCQATRGSFETMQSRSGQELARLQDQCRMAQERAAQLEARLRANLDERDRAHLDQTGLERRHGDFVNRVIHHLGVGTADDLDGLASKVAELVQENVTMKSKIHTLTDQSDAMELEAKANRETIQRLLAEVNREHRDKFEQFNCQVDLKTEAEQLQADKEDLERQVELLDGRLQATKATLEATKEEMKEKEAQVARLECERLEAEHSSQNNEKQLLTFVESLASLLSTAYCHVTPSEEAVKEKVKLLCREVKEHAASVTSLEERVRSVTHQFEQQFETNRDKEARNRRAETEFFDMRERIRALESELAAGDVLRDGLKADKEKFYKYMRRLAEVMRMDYAAVDVGFDILGDGLLVRAEQLVRQSGCEDSSFDGGLQRRLRSMKEQLDSKDLHLELLRKKVATLEASTAAVPPPISTGCSYKLQRHLEKSQDMLDEARQEVATLRAQLSQCAGIRATAIGQNRDIDVLESTMEKLERVRQRQAKKIAMLKAELDCRDRQFGDRRTVTDASLNSLGNEVKAVRRALEEARARERRLVEFRAAVARVVGLNADSLGLPDAEILARLDRLVQAQQRAGLTAFSASVGDLRPPQTSPPTFGYGEGRRGRSPARVCPACRVAQCQCRVERRHRRERRGRQERPRSSSPLRDNRRY